jgi:hypothetical protein
VDDLLLGTRLQGLAVAGLDNNGIVDRLDAVGGDGLLPRKIMRAV